MRNEAVATIGGLRVVLMDTISAIGAGDSGSVIVCGSHGGTISGAFAKRHPPALVFFNDAGGGKANGGLAALETLEGAGIACAGVAHDSARIGDAKDAWESGFVSAVNRAARDRGVKSGQSVQEAVAAFTEGAGG